jgi:hypothetical protein
MKYTLRELSKLYWQIQNLSSTTNWREYTMKYLLASITDLDELRSKLNQLVDMSIYKDDHKGLAKKLSLRYPQGNWSERTLGYMLNTENGSKRIDGIMINQLTEFLFPENNRELSLDELKDEIDEIIEKTIELRKSFVESTRKDKMICDKEKDLIEARYRILINRCEYFLKNITTVVNMRLS